MGRASYRKSKTPQNTPSWSPGDLKPRAKRPLPPRSAIPRAPRAHEKGRARDRIPDDAPAAFEALEAPHAIAATSSH